MAPGSHTLPVARGTCWLCQFPGLGVVLPVVVAPGSGCLELHRGLGCGVFLLLGEDLGIKVKAEQIQYHDVFRNHPHSGLISVS